MTTIKILLLLFTSPLLLSQTEVDNYGNKVEIRSTSQLQYTLHGKFEEGRKTIFFIDGSLPTSRYLKHKDTVYFTAPKDLLELTSDFNLVILGKPSIPILIEYKDMAKDNIYRDSTGSIPQEFLLNDNVDFYVKAYDKVIKQVSKEFQIESIFVFGHSQGSRIAAELVLQNKDIDRVILSSVDPLGRVATLIDKNYSKSEKMEQTEVLQSIVSNGMNSLDSIFMESTYYTWQSFSYPLIISLSKIKIPVLMLYGIEDKNCPNCYIYGYLGTYISNLESKAYSGYDHNFFDDNGVMHWDRVIKDIKAWIEDELE